MRVRILFLVFALISLGLWAVHLVLLSGPMGDRFLQAGANRAEAAADLAAARIAEYHAQLMPIALSLVQQPALASHGNFAKLPNPEQWAQIRAGWSNVLPGIRANLVVGVMVGGQGIASRGDEPPVTEGLDWPVIAAAGTAGRVVEAFDTVYFFNSVPLGPNDRPERPEVKLVLGLPFAPKDLVTQLGRIVDLSALVVDKGGKTLGATGIEGSKFDPLTTPAGKPAIAKRGSISSLGPLELPILTHGDLLGGEAPLSVSYRKPIGSSPVDAIAVVTVRELTAGLAEYQRGALAALAGLLLLTIAWTLWIAGPKPDEPTLSLPFLNPPSPTTGKKDAPPAEKEPRAASASGLAQAPLLEEAPPAPEATADDFHFGEPAAKSAETKGAKTGVAAPLPPPAPDAWAMAESPVPTKEVFAYEAQATVMYPGDAVPAVFSRDGEGTTEKPEAGADSTRIAMVPNELLKAMAKGAPEPRTTVAAPGPLPAGAVPPTAPSENAEEMHFQDVFREFLATRERCNEPADGLTFDRFAVKLRKNKEQLVQKYNCRSVRFQVYVKEGKAALKATPLKE